MSILEESEINSVVGVTSVFLLQIFMLFSVLSSVTGPESRKGFGWSVNNQNQTHNEFSDFEIKTEMQTNLLLFGYDQSELNKLPESEFIEQGQQREKLIKIL